MITRYGLDRRPWGTMIGAGILVVGFALALVFVTTGLSRDTLTATLVSWDDSAPGHVSVSFDVQRQGTDTVTCVIRAQDKSRADVGYADISIPPGAATIRIDYELRTLAPAYVVELLGCGVGSAANVQQPQFPPGVVPPDQPWVPE